MGLIMKLKSRHLTSVKDGVRLYVHLKRPNDEDNSQNRKQEGDFI